MVLQMPATIIRKRLKERTPCLGHRHPLQEGNLCHRAFLHTIRHGGAKGDPYKALLQTSKRCIAHHTARTFSLTFKVVLASSVGLRALLPGAVPNAAFSSDATRFVPATLLLALSTSAGTCGLLAALACWAERSAAATDAAACFVMPCSSGFALQSKHNMSQLP